ncbi:HAD-IIB family hydrolase [Roseibium salinum]|nr:HAD-IIB family hydrolase [Roseibium salinum]
MRTFFQTKGKASFAVPGRQEAERVVERLTSEGIPFKYIYSGASDLDILAPGAGKGEAMHYLAAHLGISLERTVAAGDSGNDVELFEMAGKAIAVGNAREELLAVLPREKDLLRDGFTCRRRSGRIGGIRDTSRWGDLKACDVTSWSI